MRPLIPRRSSTTTTIRSKRAFATKEEQITPDGKCFYWKTGHTIGLYLPGRIDRYNILVVSWPQVRDESGQVHDESVDAVWTFSR